MAFKRESVIKTAEKYVSKGKIEAAIKEYRKILQKAPNDISSLNRVGDLYARIQKMDDAVGLFEQIADRYTDDGFFPKAIAIYKKILKLDPRRLEAYQSLAELYQKQGLTNDARAQYQVLAAYYQKHGDLPKAIGVCQKMAELEPDNPSHHVKLADLYREGGQTSDALEAYCTIAGLMMKHGHAGEAAQVYHRALDIGAGELDFVRRAVTSLKDAGDSGAALKLVLAAGEINPAARELVGEIGLTRSAPPPSAMPAVALPEPSAAPPPARPPIAEPEPAPAFDIDESFGGIEDAPSTQVEPPADLEGPPAMEGVAIDIGSGAESELDIPLEIDWSEMPSLEEEVEELEEAPVAPELTPQPLPDEIVPPVEEEAPVRKTEDLLAEAEVFSKYGLAQKALDRFQEILDQDPDCLEAHRMRLGVLIQQADREAIGGAAQQMQEVAERLGETAEWEEMQRRLEEDGFAAPVEEPELEVLTAEPIEEPLEEIVVEEVAAIEESPALEPEPAAEVLTEVEPAGEAVFDEVPFEVEGELPDLELPELEAATDLDVGEEEGIEALEVELPSPEPVEPMPSISELSLDGDAPKDIREKRPKLARGVDAALAEITAEILKPKRKARPKKVVKPPVESVSPPAEEPPPPSSPAPEGTEVETASEPEIVEPAEMSIADALDESGMDWLDEVAASEADTEAASEKLFDDEDDFFDLAAELQDELGSEDELAAIGEPEEQSLEEIVEGFKKGVSEALSEEDVDTHYNLGIAYREMGLVDEAIGEFQLAAKDPAYLVNCCAMLGVCFVEKGLPELAVKWYQRALEHPDLGEEEYLGLMYDRGSAQAAMGEHAAAHDTFVEIYGVNSNYRDVSDRMQEAAAAAGS